jgi:hypothetical protein
VSISGDLAFGCTVLAGAIFTGVRIGGIQFRLRGLEVSEGSGGPASVTSVAVLIAVNLLLRGKFQELSSLDAVAGLDCLSSGESPARTTSALILDRSGALASPVLGRRKLFSSHDVLIGVMIRLRQFEGTEHLQVFSLGRVREMIVTSNVSRLGVSVVLQDVCVSLEVAFETDSELLDGLVALAVVSNELHELEMLLVRSFESGYDANSGDSDSKIHMVINYY